MKQIFFLVATAIFLGFGTLSAQRDSDTLTRYTLNDLTEYALQNNYEIRNAKKDIQIAKSRKWETTAIGLPQASITGTWQYLFEVPTMNMPLSITYVPDAQNPFNHMHIDTSAVWELGSESSASVDFTVSQLVFSGEYIVGLQAAKIYMSLSETGYQKKEQDVKESVTKTYYLALITDESIRILDSVYQTLNHLYTETEAFAEAGFLEVTDTEQLKLNVKTTENALLSFKNQREVIYGMLKMQTGMNQSDTLVLVSDLVEMQTAVMTVTLASQEFQAENTIDYQLLEVQEKLMHLDWNREKTTYLPTVTAFYRHQEQINAPSFNFSTPDVVGASVQIPIFSSGMRNARVTQKRLAYEQTVNQKLQAEQGLYLQHSQTLADFNTAYDKFLNQIETRNLSKKIYENTLIKFKTGTVSGMELTQAQSQYFQALSNYYQSLNELIDKQIKLKKLLNQL